MRPATLYTTQAVPTATPRCAGARAAALCRPEHCLRAPITPCTRAAAANFGGAPPRRSLAGACAPASRGSHAACRLKLTAGKNLASPASRSPRDAAGITRGRVSRGRRRRGGALPRPRALACQNGPELHLARGPGRALSADMPISERTIRQGMSAIFPTAPCSRVRARGGRLGAWRPQDSTR